MRGAPCCIARREIWIVVKNYIKNLVDQVRVEGVFWKMLVNIFKYRDDLFNAGLEPGNVDNNSAFVLVY